MSAAPFLAPKMEVSDRIVRSLRGSVRVAEGVCDVIARYITDEQRLEQGGDGHRPRDERCRIRKCDGSAKLHVAIRGGVERVELHTARDRSVASEH